MPIRNDTLRKKLDSKREFLKSKIDPLQEELEMVEGMLAQLDAHEGHKLQAAETQLGLNENSSNEG
jgi:hypothetical protein